MDSEAKSEIDSAYTSEALNERRNLQKSDRQEADIEKVILSKREKIIANISGVLGFIVVYILLAVLLQGEVGGKLPLMIMIGGFFLFRLLATNIQVQNRN